MFIGCDELKINLKISITIESAPKTSSITNGWKIQYLRYRIKSFLNAAMAAPVEYFIRCLDLELFAHSHDERVFGADSLLFFKSRRANCTKPSKWYS